MADQMANVRHTRRDAVAAVDTNLAAAMPYGVLEPGLKAAIDLLTREAFNEKYPTLLTGRDEDGWNAIEIGSDACFASFEDAKDHKRFLEGLVKFLNATVKEREEKYERVLNKYRALKELHGAKSEEKHEHKHAA
jgi:hypothetical protein